MNALIALLLAQAVLVTPNKPYAYTINHPLECAYDGQKKIHGRCISPAAVDDEWAPATATTPEHWHCWHPSTEQHAIISRTGHEDQVCCICGKTRCHTGHEFRPLTSKNDRYCIEVLPESQAAAVRWIISNKKEPK